MKVCFEDIGHMSATFAADNGEAGMVCKIIENGKVAPCGAGEKFCGVMEQIRKGFAGVQLKGFATVPFTGSAPALGYNELAANGEGGIQVAAGGRQHLVVWVDEATMHAIIEL